jgi:hypothetical protein
MRKHVLLLILAVVLAAGHARAEFYRWTDRDGREFYTNEKGKIPPEYRDSARPVEVHEERVSVGGTPAGPADRTAVIKTHKDRNGRGEEYWRKRADTLRRQIREQETAYDRVVKQQQEEERSGRMSEKSKKKYRASLEKKQEKLAGLRHELEVELPDEARKADALPGWLR